MKLKKIFECVKCFIIGDDRDTKNDIERILYPEEDNNTNLNEGCQTHQTLYIPPEEPYDKKASNSCERNYGINQKDIIDTVQTENLDSTSYDNCKKINKNDNKETLPIINELVELIIEFDRTKSKLIASESVEIISFCQNRIIESIVKQSGDLINNDTIYSNERHIPMPFIIAPNGSTIKKISRPGIIINNKVVLKAIVELDI